MSEGLKFSVELEDHVSKEARKAAESLRGMASQLTDVKGKIDFYQRQVDEAKRTGDTRRSWFNEAMLGSHKQELHELQNKHGTSSEIEAAARAWDKYADGVEHAGLGLSKLLPVIDLAEVAHMAGDAIVEMGSFLFELGRKAVETALDVSALNNRLTATFEAIGTQGPGSGKRTLDMLNDMSSKLPQSREQLADYTKTFEAMGITDLGQLRYQIQATASAQAIMGDSGAEAYEHLSKKIRLAAESGQKLELGEKPLEKLYKMGTNVTDVADRLGISVAQLRTQLKHGGVDANRFGNALSESLIAKGKGPLDAMSSSIDVLREKGTETFRHLFDGVDVSPLTDALRMVLSLGDAGAPAGAGMKMGVKAGVNGIMKVLGEAVIQGAVFFLNLEASAIRFHTKILPIINAIEKLKAIFDRIDKGIGAGFANNLPPALRPIVGSAFDTLAMRQPSHAGATAEWRKRFGPAGELPPQLEPIVPPMLARPATPPKEIPATSSGMIHRVVDTAIAAHGGVHKVTTVNGLVVHITAPDGVTDAQSMSVTGIGAGLERLQLMGGR